jgi:4-hydroxybutyrate CoA-transferase
VHWREEYERKQTTPDEAVKAVTSGDLVALPLFGPVSIAIALGRRRAELRDVTLRLTTPAVDPGWFAQDWSDAFTLEFDLFIGPFGRPATDARRGSYVPVLFSTQFKHHDERSELDRPYDVAVVNLSPPNRQGFCNLGVHMWNKRSFIRRAKTVIAEVVPDLPIAHGTTWVHVSEIDAFVDGAPQGGNQLVTNLAALVPEERRAAVAALLREADQALLTGVAAELRQRIADLGLEELRELLAALRPPPEARPIAEFVAELIRDGDCLQIGTGDPARWLVTMGALDGRRELGYQSEMAAPGIARLVERGVITGEGKQIYRGKAVAVAWSGCEADELAYIDDNPRFELHEPEELLRIPVVAANDNVVAINNALAIDLTGQINAESVFGPRMLNGTGGQPENHIGAFLSRGGRAITLLPSTALGGAVSRVVAQFEPGAIVTIPRYFADIVVSEYGVARLAGKSAKARAHELIRIAHPDFRAELRRQAEQLF